MPGRNEEHAHVGDASSRTRRTLLVSPPEQLAGELPERAQARSTRTGLIFRVTPRH